MLMKIEFTRIADIPNRSLLELPYNLHFSFSLKWELQQLFTPEGEHKSYKIPKL